jgi:glycosyltransferase involved in cell wall biosynthesis
MTPVPRPLVTAIIPTHDRAHSLPRALDSVYAQDQRGECFDLEIIVVDDASTDATAEVVRRYPDLRYIRLPEWRGVSATCNEGLRASRGCYIAFLDDDDLWLSHKLRVQVPLLQRHPEVGVVYGQTLVRRGGEEFLSPEATRAPSGWVFMAMLRSNFCGHHASCLIRREAFEKAGVFDESLASYEDYDLSLRLAFHVRFLFAPGAVDIYNLSPQGLWLSRAASGAAALDAARVIEKALRLLPDSPDHAAVKREARLQVVRDTAWWMLDTLGDLKDVWRLVMVTLRASMARHDAVRGHVRRMARGTTLAPSAPVSVLRRIGDHLKTAYLLRRVIVRVILRIVLGHRAYTWCVRAYQQVARRP